MTKSKRPTQERVFQLLAEHFHEQLKEAKQSGDKLDPVVLKEARQFVKDCGMADKSRRRSFDEDTQGNLEETAKALGGEGIGPIYPFKSGS